MPENPSVPRFGHRDYSKGRSLILRMACLAGILVGSCLFLLLALSLWNLAATKWEHAHNPVPGNFYSVDGRQMHIYCTGAGSPAVVMEAGASSTWLAWRRVQPELSQLTRVCSYDRAGHGWSEPRSGPRDAETAVQELHALLDRAGVQRPLVLTGHSAGGLYIREYAREFPAEVAGVVLIDSSSPQQIDELPGWRQSYEADKHDFARQLRWEKLRVWSGWERLMGRCRVLAADEAEVQGFVGQYDAMMCRPAYVGGEDNEFMYFETTCKQAARLTSFGNVPLLVISQDPHRRREGMTANAIVEQPVWAREQEALKSLSPLSWRVIARGSGHNVHHERLDIVLAETAQLIAYLRGGQAPPFDATAIK